MLCAARSLFGENSPRQVYTLSRSYLSDVQGVGTCHVLYVQTLDISDFQHFEGNGEEGGVGGSE